MKIISILKNSQAKQCFGKLAERDTLGETSYCAAGVLLEIDEFEFWAECDYVGLITKKEILEAIALAGIKIKRTRYIDFGCDKGISLYDILTILNDDLRLSFKEIAEVLEQLEITEI